MLGTDCTASVACLIFLLLLLAFLLESLYTGMVKLFNEIY